MSTAPDGPGREADRPGRRYEYTTVEVHEPMDIEALDVLGREGWRLAAVGKYRFTIFYTLMRPARGNRP
jgi:hypothetical protein